MTDRKLTATVVGAGAGGMLSVRALAASERFELIGVADLSDAALAAVAGEFGDGVGLYTDYEQMFAQCPSDVVCVSTYAPSHLAVTRAAVSAGAVRGLLVEKPLCDSALAGRELLDLLQIHGLPVVVPHGLMAQAAAIEVLEVIAAGAIGELQLVEVECTSWDLINAGIHWVQYALAALTPRRAQVVLAAADTSTRTFRDGLQVETESLVMARFDDGVRLILNCGDFVPVTQSDSVALIRFVGTTGVIEYGAYENRYTIAAVGREREQVAVMPFAVSGHRRHLEHLADQIGGSGERDMRIPELSLDALEIIQAAYESHRVRGLVTVPIDGTQPERVTDWNAGAPYSGVGGGRNGREL